MVMDLIAVIDFGSQVTQLIARRLRELGYYAEIFPYTVPTEVLRSKNPKGIILSGGPNSVYEEDAPNRDVQELAEMAPLLGICYGMQLMASQMGGIVQSAEHREYGFNKVTWKHTWAPHPLEQKVWMSHGDVVKVPPPGFEILGTSSSNHPAAMASERMWAVQFHPEVTHTEYGSDILGAFAEKLCHIKPNWNAPSMLQMLKEKAQTQVGPNDHILVGLSGGVDSTVVATLLTHVFGAERVHCVFVDNGLLRKDEFRQVLDHYKTMGLNITGVDAAEYFMKQLSGIDDPEIKRKTIGKSFIKVFEKTVPEGKPVVWLAQGTLYPDVIESVSPRGGSVTIKSHHNVGGLPEHMKLKLLEPLRELFKDEVRVLGRQLGIPESLIGRHPFPGPGLAVRVLGALTPEALETLRDCDDIFISALKAHKLYDRIWQAFAVLLPIKTVGVQGDGRTYANVVALRAVTSQDGMTADWFSLSEEFMRTVSTEITNRVKGVNRVVYDITSKPPGTIEWE